MCLCKILSCTSTNMKTHFFVSLLFFFFSSSTAASIGICYGRVASNHPSPSTIVTLLQNNGLTAVRIFKPDPEVLQSFSNSGINLMIGVPNEMLPSLASNPFEFAIQWLQDNIFNHIIPAQLKYLAVGNEVFLKDPYYTPFLVPSINNLQQALKALNLDQFIKISTPLATSILATSFPPSNGSFDPSSLPQVIPLLKFLEDNNSPLMINVYPYFSYLSNQKDVGLDYALFNTKGALLDNGLLYDNLYDATLDSFVAAMEKEGFHGVQIVVAETGWPTAGGEAASTENARIYNGHVVRKALQNVGTPMRPSVGVELFLFDLFDEDEKIGEEYEKHFGVFGLDGSKIYDVNFSLI